VNSKHCTSDVSGERNQQPERDMQYNIFQMDGGQKKHKGGCHCGRVRFEVIAPSQVTVIECSCDPCGKRQSRYFSVAADQFRLLKGHGELSTFGSAAARHSFCTTCGVQSFVIPSGGDNDVVGVMPHCLDAGTMKKVKTEKRQEKPSCQEQEQDQKETPKEKTTMREAAQARPGPSR